jgi:hypothetical protein
LVAAGAGGLVAVSVWVIVGSGWLVFKALDGGAAPAPPPSDAAAVTVPPTQAATGPGPRKNCARSPHACGYPDRTNTGMPAGTAARRVPEDVASGPGWHYDTRGWIEVDGDGAVLEAFQSAASVSVEASNVTIRNCRLALRTTAQTAAEHSGAGVLIRNGSTNVTVQNCEIFGSGRGADRLEVGIKAQEKVTGTRVIGNEIYHMCTGVQTDEGLIQDNYLHDFGFYDWGPPDGPDHLNGTTSNAYSGRLTIRHNTIFNQFGQTDAISLFEDFSPQYDRVITNNLVAGGGYTIYGGANAGGHPTSHIVITNNRFSRLYFRNGGGYGPVAAFDPRGHGNLWSGNIWDDTGLPVTA